MPNPYLPGYEYIPDGEPRVFGERVYIYGSHDKANSERFCDTKLKVWSASVYNLNEWVCHGDIFHTKADEENENDAPWSKENELYAPDVIEKDGKYYLYAYIFDAHGCVGVSDKPEGPFKLLSKYEFIKDETKADKYDGGIFVDPGVLVDDDGRVFVYCGYQHSWMAELNPENMYQVIEGSFQEHIIPMEEPFNFYEACSPRKINGIYYMIYSPTKNGSMLVYATATDPKGPYEYRGIIVDNGQEYPGGNNHGSVAFINGQWYIFYHRMTNGTVMSRRACVERITMLEDGSIPQVEMTSLGFEESLNPYKETVADIACVLKGGCMVSEKNIFSRPIINITNGCIVGYKYFDFGEDYASKTINLSMEIAGHGARGVIKIVADNEQGDLLGTLEFGGDDSIITGSIKKLTGRHSIYFIFEDNFGGWFIDMFKGRQLCDLKKFVFHK
jgi:hypothetical protein